MWFRSMLKLLGTLRADGDLYRLLAFSSRRGDAGWDGNTYLYRDRFEYLAFPPACQQRGAATGLAFPEGSIEGVVFLLVLKNSSSVDLSLGNLPIQVLTMRRVLPVIG